MKRMKLLYGTGNSSKLRAMREVLSQFDIEIRCGYQAEGDAGHIFLHGLVDMVLVQNQTDGVMVSGGNSPVFLRQLSIVFLHLQICEALTTELYLAGRERI